MIRYVDQVAIAVKNLDEKVKIYESLLLQSAGSIEEVRSEKVKLAMFQVGETKIELLEGIGPDSPIHKFIEKRGEGVHHMALKVDDMDRAINMYKEKGFTFIEPAPRVGAEGSKVAFIHPKSTGGVLIELVE
ncbi:MAG: methylmalonyl-CoA epimerase [Bdellovibrionales bacterium]|nr:methylmalonyl-CoA epimerase [Bdellovibrionales bacterium]